MPISITSFFSPRVVTHAGDNTISYTSFHNRSNTLSCTPERKEEVSIHNLSGTYRVAAQRGFEAYGDFTRRCSYSFVGLLCIIDGFASSRRSARDLSMETRCRVFFVHRNMRSKYCTASWGRRPVMKKGKSFECVNSIVANASEAHAELDLSETFPSSRCIRRTPSNLGSMSLSSSLKCSFVWSCHTSDIYNKHEKKDLLCLGVATASEGICCSVVKNPDKSLVLLIDIS